MPAVVRLCPLFLLLLLLLLLQLPLLDIHFGGFIFQTLCQGNISEAVGYATQQLSVYYMPDVLYDIATMEVRRG